MLVGTMGYMVIDNFSLMDALYQTGITFTTVGFGEISPISYGGRLFTIALIVFGFMIFTFSIGILIDVLNKGDLIKLMKERSMLKKIARLKNHIVVCYHNDYTVTLARYFRQNHIPFVVVDDLKDMEQIAKKHKYPYFVQGKPHSSTAFLKSCLASAKGIITLSSNEADNIAVISSVKVFESDYGIEDKLNTMTYIKNEDSTRKFKKLGANIVISPSKLMAERFLTMSVRPDMQNILEEFLYQKKSPLDLEEVEVPSFSWVRLKKIKETHLRDSINVSIVGIKDENNKFITMPDGETIITQNSTLLLLGKGDDIQKAKKLVKSKEKPEELKYV
jgi:voltage-gated potassium channel